MTSVDCIYSGLEHFAQPSYMFCALELIWVLAQIHSKWKQQPSSSFDNEIN
jgi:hypothetical protein